MREPEVEFDTNCPDRGSRGVCRAVAPPGAVERSIYLRCSGSGSERPEVRFL
jgi:hypothetical protein